MYEINVAVLETDSPEFSIAKEAILSGRVPESCGKRKMA